MPPPMELVTLSGWRTSAVHLGLTGGYAPGSAFVSPIPPVWQTAELNPEEGRVPPYGYPARLMRWRTLHPVPGRR